MKTVAVVTFNEREPAEQLRQELGEAGFQAFVHDESRLERFGFMSEPLAAFHVEVHPADFLTARRLIADWESSSPVLKEAVRCPECNSPRVEYPQTTRKFLTPVLLVALMTLRLIPREYYCLDCHFTWPNAQPVEPERDILGWPLHSKYWHPPHRASRPARWSAARLLLGPPDPHG